MDKPMVYLEAGCWAHGVAGDAYEYWLEPGWYEVLPEGKDLWRNVEMIVFKEDTEPAYTGLGREYGPTFDSFREMTRYLQGHDPDTASVSWQIEDQAEALTDTETISSLLLPLDTLSRDQHLLHQVPPHGLLALSYGESTDTHRDDLDDSSLQL